MKLFRGVITYRANKQDTITISSFKAELLAISQTVKEIIYLFWLIKALTLFIPKALIIECDNKQII